MDYAAWLDRLLQTLAVWKAKLPPERQKEYRVLVDPPLTSHQLVGLRNSLDIPLPGSVAKFLTRAASRVVYECPIVNAAGENDWIAGELFNYWFWEERPRSNDEEYLGALQGMPLVRHLACARGDGAWLEEPEWVLDRALWRHALPLTCWPNTDGLALWCHDPHDKNPGVLWLEHDGPSKIICPDFDTFLSQLEYLGYEWGDVYLGGETGMIQPGCEAAKRRRRLLGLSDET